MIKKDNGRATKQFNKDIVLSNDKQNDNGCAPTKFKYQYKYDGVDYGRIEYDVVGKDDHLSAIKYTKEYLYQMFQDNYWWQDYEMGLGLQLIKYQFRNCEWVHIHHPIQYNKDFVDANDEEYTLDKGIRFVFIIHAFVDGKIYKWYLKSHYVCFQIHIQEKHIDVYNTNSHISVLRSSFKPLQNYLFELGLDENKNTSLTTSKTGLKILDKWTIWHQSIKTPQGKSLCVPLALWHIQMFICITDDKPLLTNIGISDKKANGRRLVLKLIMYFLLEGLHSNKIYLKDDQDWENVKQNLIKKYEHLQYFLKHHNKRKYFLVYDDLDSMKKGIGIPDVESYV